MLVTSCLLESIPAHALLLTCAHSKDVKDVGTQISLSNLRMLATTVLHASSYQLSNLQMAFVSAKIGYFNLVHGQDGTLTMAAGQAAEDVSGVP